MWEAGITFGHGTGHGVGHFLGCHTKATTTEDEWLAFETLTLCFYDTSLIELSLMTEDEIDWNNAYHVRVYKEISPLLNSEEKSYLARKCAAIEL